MKAFHIPFLSKRSISFFVGVVLVAGLALSIYAGLQTLRNEKDLLLARALIISKILHRPPIEGTHGDERDLKNSDYDYLKKKMIDLKAVNPDIRFVYLLGYKKNLDKLYFIVDSEYPNTDDYSPPGQIYDEASPELVQSFLNGVPFIESVSDRWGWWISAHAPIFDAGTNLPLAMVGLDVPATRFIGSLLISAMLPLVVAALCAVFLLTIYHYKLSQKSFELNNVKMEFSSFTSHEIRGFVTRMKYGLKSLIDEDMGKLSAEQIAFVSELFRTSNDFGDLIEEFLDIGKMEQDSEITLHIEQYNLFDIIHNVAEDLKDSLLKKEITIVYEGNVPAKAYSACDNSKISRVFSNIIGNALKYSPQKSSIRVGYIDSNTAHTISVKDSGIGIPPEDQSKIFMKFYRADNAKDVHITGTGLGLYFSKLIVEKHGGKIWFESTEGAGTTFFVSLPKA